MQSPNKNTGQSYISTVLSPMTRGQRYDDNESYNGGASSMVSVKAEKVKVESVKKGKQRESRRVRDSDDEDDNESEDNNEEEDDELANGAGPEIDEEEDELANGAGPEIDDDEEEEEEEDAEDASPRSRKRVRVNGEGGSREVKDEPSQRTRIKTLPRGEDG